MQARVTSIINCGLATPPTKAVRIDGSFVYPETFCEVAGNKISPYTTEAVEGLGIFDVKCNQVGCRFYGGRRGEQLG